MRPWRRGWRSRGSRPSPLRAEMVEAQGLSDEPIAVDLQLRPAIRTARETVRVDRILDAAANRCREGLRVVEDFARFVLDDAHLSRLLKEQRHDLAAALSLLPADRMLAARDTPGDVGTSVQTAAEQHRDHAADVVRANCKRVEESLRTLEEYSKTERPDASERFESLRYRFYTIEQALTQTFRSRDRLADARLYLLVTDRHCPQGAGPLHPRSPSGGRRRRPTSREADARRTFARPRQVRPRVDYGCGCVVHRQRSSRRRRSVRCRRRPPRPGRHAGSRRPADHRGRQVDRPSRPIRSSRPGRPSSTGRTTSAWDPCFPRKRRTSTSSPAWRSCGRSPQKSPARGIRLAGSPRRISSKSSTPERPEWRPAQRLRRQTIRDRVLCN